MIEESTIFDEALERLSASGFETPNGFVNHAPMACEALSALGRYDAIDEWSRRTAHAGIPVEAAFSPRFEWNQSLGNYRLLPEWMGYFDRAVDEQGWSAVVEQWVPLLLPGLSVALFHGVIRSAHAVRAVSRFDTEPRRAELARALAYWAARYHVGEPVMVGDQQDEEPVDLDLAIVETAAHGALRYLRRPNIFNLHGVTGAMAVALLVDHIPPEAGWMGLAQLRAEHAVLYQATDPVSTVSVLGVSNDVVTTAAAASGDPHQVKLVEACRRGFEVTGQPVFVAAAEVVTSAHA